MSEGKIIKQLRKDKNVTQKDLAQRVGMSVRSLYSYESGEKSMDWNTFYQLTVALEADPWVLVKMLHHDNLESVIKAVADEKPIHIEYGCHNIYIKRDDYYKDGYNFKVYDHGHEICVKIK